MMTAATLANILDNLGPVDNEPDVLYNWAIAYTAYMMESAVGGISPADASVFAACETAMKAAMVGISTTGLAASKIVAGVKAYWNAIAPAFATIWITAPPLVSFTSIPTGVLTSGAELAFTNNLIAVFTANTTGELSAVDAYAAVASVIHGNSSGAMVVQGPVPPGTPLPVL